MDHNEEQSWLEKKKKKKNNKMTMIQQRRQIEDSKAAMEEESQDREEEDDDQNSSIELSNLQDTNNNNNNNNININKMDDQQLCDLEMEMRRMKEENRLLREVVEKTAKDYYQLQMKLTLLQQQNCTNSQVDPEIYLSLGGKVVVDHEDETATTHKPNSMIRRRSIDDDELGLSLKLQTTTSAPLSHHKQHQEEEEEEDNYKLVESSSDIVSSMLVAQPNKQLRRINHHQTLDLSPNYSTSINAAHLSATTTTSTTSASRSSPPNRKARVSVRARCQYSTVHE
ncbi:Probable WRKY transcription factor 9 [Linum grandiflorum]